MDDEAFMKLALELAGGGPAGEVPVGCVITRTAGWWAGDATRRKGPERVMPWGAGGHRPGLQNAGRLAALAVYAVRHPGALPHVRRSHSQRADSRVVFGARDPKAGACGSVCDLFRNPSTITRPVPPVCWRSPAPRYSGTFSGTCGSSFRIEQNGKGRNRKRGCCKGICSSPFRLQEGERLWNGGIGGYEGHAWE